MRTTTTLTTLGAAVALALAGCSAGDEPQTHHTTSAHHDQGAGTRSGADANEADVTYAEGMRMHHQQAIDMADIVLDKPGLDPDVAALAERIKKAQGPEITKMDSWLEDWDDRGHGSGHGGRHGSGHGGRHGSGHGGMVSEADIAKLESADGEQASRLFLDQMIEHHEGAVDMAEAHLEDGTNPEALQLSEDVVRDQEAEIKEMREMRSSL